MPPNWQQVFNVYLYAGVLIAIGVYTSMNFNHLTKQFGTAWVIAGIVIVLFAFLMIFGVSRNAAMRKAGLDPVRRRRRRR
jgi:hypothetical protein